MTSRGHLCEKGSNLGEQLLGRMCLLSAAVVGSYVRPGSYPFFRKGVLEMSWRCPRDVLEKTSRVCYP